MLNNFVSWNHDLHLQDKFVSLVIELPQLDRFLCFMIYQGWKDLFNEFMN